MNVFLLEVRGYIKLKNCRKIANYFYSHRDTFLRGNGDSFLAEARLADSQPLFD